MSTDATHAVTRPATTADSVSPSVDDDVVNHGSRAPSHRPLRRCPLTPQTVLALQSQRAYPSISLLLTTRPGPALDPVDAVGLAALVEQARIRLAAERSADADAVADALTDVGAHLDGPVDRAVALFVSATHSARVDLPVDVADRCVVDPSFATRDLVRALHRTPRHVVLLLSADEARLLDGAGDTLAPVPVGFPLTDPGHRTGEPPRLKFLVTVDKALGSYLRLHPAPLVIVAAQPTLASFRWMSRNTQRLAGTIAHDHIMHSTAELGARIRTVLEDYLLSRRAEAISLLAARNDRGRAVYGVQKAWTAARWERPEMLAVEQGFFYPARLGDDGDTVHPAHDPHEPDVIDDLVDELIELVLSRGGWVALLDDDTLPAGTGVALTLHEARYGDMPDGQPAGTAARHLAGGM